MSKNINDKVLKTVGVLGMITAIVLIIVDIVVRGVNPSILLSGMAFVLSYILYYINK